MSSLRRHGVDEPIESNLSQLQVATIGKALLMFSPSFECHSCMTWNWYEWSSVSHKEKDCKLRQKKFQDRKNKTWFHYSLGGNRIFWSGWRIYHLHECELLRHLKCTEWFIKYTATVNSHYPAGHTVFFEWLEVGMSYSFPLNLALMFRCFTKSAQPWLN